MTVPAGEYWFACDLKSQGGWSINQRMLIQDCKVCSSNPSSSHGRKTLINECFTCLTSITWRFWHKAFLCIIKNLTDVKCFLKLFESHFSMAIRGRIQNDYWDPTAAGLLHEGVKFTFCRRWAWLFLTSTWYGRPVDVRLCLSIFFTLSFSARWIV